METNHHFISRFSKRYINNSIFFGETNKSAMSKLESLFKEIRNNSIFSNCLEYEKPEFTQLPMHYDNEALCPYSTIKQFANNIKPIDKQTRTYSDEISLEVKPTKKKEKIFHIKKIKYRLTNLIKNKKDPANYLMQKRSKNNLSAKMSRSKKKAKFQSLCKENNQLRAELKKTKQLYQTDFLSKINSIETNEKAVNERDFKIDFSSLDPCIETRSKLIDLIICKLIKLILPMEVKLITNNYCSALHNVSLLEMTDILTKHKLMLEKMDKNYNFSSSLKVSDLIVLIDELFNLINASKKALSIFD